MEDLWAFNEEPAVYAVARSTVPVISAVGHESDTTLCDYVADLRAGTPSIAAERAVPVKSELVLRVANAAGRLTRAPMRKVESWTQQLDYLSHQLGQAPHAAIMSVEHRLDRAATRLKLLDPSGVLSRGYSITLDAEGHVVTSAATVAAGQVLTTRLKDGEIESQVTAKG